MLRNCESFKLTTSLCFQSNHLKGHIRRYTDWGKQTDTIMILRVHITIVLSLYMVVISGLEVKIGLLLTTGRCCDFMSFEDKASAFNIAIDQLRQDGVLDETVTFRFVPYLVFYFTNDNTCRLIFHIITVGVYCLPKTPLVHSVGST